MRSDFKFEQHQSDSKVSLCDSHYEREAQDENMMRKDWGDGKERRGGYENSPFLNIPSIGIACLTSVYSKASLAGAQV